MREYIAFDSHKHYTWVEHQEANTGKLRQYRLEHESGAIQRARRLHSRNGDMS